MHRLTESRLKDDLFVSPCPMGPNRFTFAQIISCLSVSLRESPVNSLLTVKFGEITLKVTKEVFRGSLSTDENMRHVTCDQSQAFQIDSTFISEKP